MSRYAHEETVKLFRVEMKRVLYIEAETSSEAEDAAIDIEPNDAEIEVSSVREASEREARKDAWIYAEPYHVEDLRSNGNDHGGRTVEDILKHQ